MAGKSFEGLWNNLAGCRAQGLMNRDSVSCGVDCISWRRLGSRTERQCCCVVSESTQLFVFRIRISIDRLQLLCEQ